MKIDAVDLQERYVDRPEFVGAADRAVPGVDGIRHLSAVQQGHNSVGALVLHVDRDAYIASRQTYDQTVRRTQIYLDEELDAALRQAAAAEGRSAAALIREAVRCYVSKEVTDAGADPLLSAAGAVTGMPPDAAEHHDRGLYRGPSRRRSA